MIYERGSLESRAMKMPSAWKSNKHPPWIGEWGSGMYRKPFTGWSCIKQTSPPQIFMGRDLLINLSLSSISLFCIHQELGAVIGCNHLHFTFTRVLADSCSLFCPHAADNESTQYLSFLFWRHFVSEIRLGSSCDERVKETVTSSLGINGVGVWVTTHITEHAEA